VENLIRNVDKEAKIGVVVIMSALFGTDILSSQHSQPFLARVERRAFGDRPTLQGAIEFQPEIVMKAGSLVLLHDEDQRGFHASLLLKLLPISNLPLLLHSDRLHQ
jgi:hypothetical protein